MHISLLFILPQEYLLLCLCLEDNQSVQILELLIHQHITLPPIRPRSCPKWLSYVILLKPTLFTQLSSRHSTISISRHRQFKVGDNVWLSIPTAGKLNPKWEGGRKVVKVISPINMQIHDGKRTRVVHINRLRQPALEEEGIQNETSPWTPPQIEHIVPTTTIYSLLSK